MMPSSVDATAPVRECQACGGIAGECMPPGCENVVYRCAHFDGRVVHLHRVEYPTLKLDNWFVCAGPDEPAFRNTFYHRGTAHKQRLYSSLDDAIAAFEREAAALLDSEVSDG